MIAPEDISGLVLAGGRSRRMQSQGGANVDKGLLVLEGVPMVQHAAQTLRPWVSQVFISANSQLDLYSRYGLCVFDDPEFGGDAGPLAGVASVMAVSSRPWLLVLPVDVLHVPENMAARLVEAVDQGAPLAYACAGGRAHPLCMLLRQSLLADLRAYLLGGGRKVLDWHERHDAVAVNFGDDAKLFSNINTPADWRAAGGRVEGI